VYGRTGVGVDENYLDQAPRPYPNPTSDRITIDLGAVRSDVRLIVHNALGQEVLRESRESVRRVELLIPGGAGIYFVEVVSAEGGRAVLRVVKER
jgi:hypothetical protein